MIRSLVVVFSLFLTCSTYSVGCIDDFDLDAKDRQGYDYRIPHSNEAGYWSEDVIKINNKDEITKVFWNRNFYIFGKFIGESNGEDTTISAGLYRGKELIYKTVINCDSGTWRNWVLDRKTKQKRVLLHGNIQKNLTSCKAGEDFDLILKNDNRRLANWIFNAQPLQHDVEFFSKKTIKVLFNQAVHDRYDTGPDKYEGRKIDLGAQVTEKSKRPAVKVDSKYSTFAATRFEFTATGRAVFSRLAFGQCNAWPKNMEMQCQKVRTWIQHRSKANFTAVTLAGTKKINPENGNFSRGLGVFGNNKHTFLPDCLTDKYFNFFQPQIHGNKFLPLKSVRKTYILTDNNGQNVYRYAESKNQERAFCCCTNMKTGRVLDDDERKNCISLTDCLANDWTCRQAFDPEIGMEIEEQLQKDKQEKQEAYMRGLQNGNGIIVKGLAGVKAKRIKKLGWN
ncbi:uncharacterized protein LOC134825086 [Bolinopsis microptera]|uniref:uncharacterized protein LOC134825086 n=1 Tax=Bolinopsis microptera TaxID=2820187 RepID=UPI0030799A94